MNRILVNQGLQTLQLTHDDDSAHTQRFFLGNLQVGNWKEFMPSYVHTNSFQPKCITCKRLVRWSEDGVVVLSRTLSIQSLQIYFPLWRSPRNGSNCLLDLQLLNYKRTINAHHQRTKSITCKRFIHFWNLKIGVQQILDVGNPKLILLEYELPPKGPQRWQIFFTISHFLSSPDSMARSSSEAWSPTDDTWFWSPKQESIWDWWE